MAIFKGREGEWKTLDNGVHIFIANGQSLQDAIKNLKPREYNSYWLRNENVDFESYRGVSKREYNESLAKGKTGYIKKYGTGFYERIPDDIEYRMWNTLNSITDIKNPGDFLKQLRSKLFGDGVNIDNYNKILDAFDDDIVERYNELIKPQRDKLNNIDIDNSYDVFENNINKENISNKFKESINNLFDKGKDENLKTLLAVNSELGIGYTENLKTYPGYSGRIGTCYMPSENKINMLNEDHDVDSLYHENFHGIFDKYNVKDSDLNEVLRNEFDKKKVKEVLNHFGPEEYAKRNNIDYKTIKNNYDNSIKEYNDLRNQLDDIYNQELNKINDRSALGYKVLHERLSQNKTYQDINEKYKTFIIIKQKAEAEYKNLERKAESEFSFMYPNLNDMLSGATNGRHGYGHTRSYWKEDETNQVNEFFAEIAAIKASGNNEELEMVKKFLPNSVKKWEEVVNNILKDKGKALDLRL